MCKSPDLKAKERIFATLALRALESDLNTDLTIIIFGDNRVSPIFNTSPSVNSPAFLEWKLEKTDNSGEWNSWFIDKRHDEIQLEISRLLLNIPPNKLLALQLN